MSPRIPIYKIHHPPSPCTAAGSQHHQGSNHRARHHHQLHPAATTTYNTTTATTLPPLRPRHSRHHHHSNNGGFSSRCHRRGGLWVADWPPPPQWSLANFRSLAYFSMHGAVRCQTTIVVAVRRRYSHHSRTMWCRAVAAQPLRVPRCAQPFDATAVAATEPAVATTAAPWWCLACGDGNCVPHNQLLYGKSNQVFHLYPSWKCLKVVELLRMTVGPNAAYAMTWVDMKKKTTDKYCPRGEMKKLESKLWNLRVKSNDVGSYNQRFQQLALLCVRMFLEEADKSERYVGGLPDVIHGSVVASRPKTMQKAIEIANELMDKRNNTWAERQAENKRKDDNNNQAHQQPLKKQGVAIAYTAGPGERKEYAGTLPLCNKYKFHHNGQCTVKCINYKRVGHLTRDCMSHTATNNHRNPTCYEGGNQGHYRSDCPELKNQDHGRL
nr:hypothetical protein [Tanacetum cinerariifolium]